MNTIMKSYESSSVVIGSTSLITEQEDCSGSSSSLPPLCDSRASIVPQQDDNMPHRRHRKSIRQSHLPNNTAQRMSKSTILFTILTLTLSTTLTTASSTTTRHLDFNSYWNGEWQAGDSSYECQDCDDAQLYNNQNQRHSDMWVDDNIQQYMSEEYLIIRNVSIALVALLALSCCMCYPECLILTLGAVWKKINCCCPAKEDEGDGEYVGGRMEGERKKKKKKKSKEPQGLAANSGVELV